MTEEARDVLLDQEYELVAVDELKVHPKNPNQGDVGAIIESIDVNGFFGALIVQLSTKFVLAGNHRLLAAMHHGVEEVPVIWVDVDDEQANRILIAEQHLARMGQNNEPMLAELLTQLAMSPTGLAGTGYDGDDLDAMLNMLNDDAPAKKKRERAESFNVSVRCETIEEQQQTLTKLLAQGFDARAR